MSKNPFAPQNQGELKLKRNVYDLSRQSLFTTDFGRMSPAFIQEVIPGDSFEITSSLAIQGMPTVFPLQTRCRVSVEYYYGRNRCVMDEFEDFIFKTKDIEHPWLRMNSERAKKMISTGSLGDLFGLPTTYANDSTVFINPSLTSPSMFGITGITSYNSPRTFDMLDFYLTSNAPRFLTDDVEQAIACGYVSSSINFPLNINRFQSSSFSYTGSFVSEIKNVALALFDSNTSKFTSVLPLTISYTINGTSCILDYQVDSHYSLYLETKKITDLGHSFVLEFLFYGDVLTDDKYVLDFPNSFFPTAPSTSYLLPAYLSIPSLLIGVYDSTDDSLISNNPFVGNSPDIKVNALPFRHYEMICNYYARNDKNNPFMLNGEPQYNEFIPTHAAGADDNLYDYHYRNWELDRFTSAVQSPQFGEAPLVGLTFTGSDTATLTFTDSDSNTYTAEVGVDDNDVVTTIQNFSQDIPSANLRKLQEMIHYGISINDLRVTNSFQRFLENVLRRGLRYRNQLKSHFGVGVDYPDIDIPQYIGGYSGELVVSKVTSTAQTSEANLGDFNGQLSGMIQSKHKIHCYCPEHGFIIGIVSITPIPVYTQVADKSMIKNEPFDYFLPEFGKIGFVPVHYSEVMPLQTPVDGSVNDVFGYQKAWYDYMQSLDSAHGYFRTNLKDFVLQRVFAERPDLVEDFTVINPEQLTDVFVTGNIADKYNMSDKFLCNFYNHVVSKRPIPRVGTPSLE